MLTITQFERMLAFHGEFIIWYKAVRQVYRKTGFRERESEEIYLFLKEQVRQAEQMSQLATEIKMSL